MKNVVVRLVFAVFGIFLLGVGIAFNANAFLGNDAIAILYDGIRNAFGLSMEKLGLVTNLVNLTVIVILVFIGRRYLNIGTVLYMVLLGIFVNAGTAIYPYIFSENVFVIRFLAGVCGSIGIILGVAFFITVDIGIDPFNAVVLIISNQLNWTYGKTKICLDAIYLIIGILLGGTFGVITLLMVVTAGPSIQLISDLLKSRCSWMLPEQKK